MVIFSDFYIVFDNFGGYFEVYGQGCDGDLEFFGEGFYGLDFAPDCTFFEGVEWGGFGGGVSGCGGDYIFVFHGMVFWAAYSVRPCTSMYMQMPQNVMSAMMFQNGGRWTP